MKRILAGLLVLGSLTVFTACGRTEPAQVTEDTLPLPLWAQNEEDRETVPETTAAEVDRPALPEDLEESEETIIEETVTRIPGKEPAETEVSIEVPQTTEEETAPVQTEVPISSYAMEEKFQALPEETVYAVKRVNIRAQGNVNSVALNKLQQGDEVIRVGISEDGWSAILYEDKVCYVASEYLTKDGKPEPTENPNVPQEQEVDDMVYTVDDVNMREGPGFDRAVLCRVPEYVELHRTGIVNSGWSKITYKDKVGYISTGYLAEKHPGSSGEVEEESVSDTVYTTRELNFRKGPGTDQVVIGRIPEGTKLERTAVTATGWGKVTYEGETGYVSGDYLSKDPPADG